MQFAPINNAYVGETEHVVGYPQINNETILRKRDFVFAEFGNISDVVTTTKHTEYTENFYDCDNNTDAIPSLSTNIINVKRFETKYSILNNRFALITLCDFQGKCRSDLFPCGI